MIEHLYIHIPFCPNICPYCAFYKESAGRQRVETFLDALLLELESYVRRAFFLEEAPRAHSRQASLKNF